MDTTPKQFIAVVKKLTEVLNSCGPRFGQIADSIYQHTAALRQSQAERQASAKQRQSEVGKEQKETRVRVDGAITVDLAQNLKGAIETECRDRKTSADEQLLWTKIGAGLLFLYSLFTLWQACSTKEMARTAQQQLISSERAYVSFSGLGNAIKGIGPSGAVTGDISSLRFDNSGNTPVPKGMVRVGHGFFDSGLPAHFDYPIDPGELAFTSPPKQTTVIDYNFPIDDEIKIRDRTARYFIWGTVVYRDIFPDSPVHVTEFCMEVQGLLRVGAGKVDVTDPNMTTIFKGSGCGTHTCYDQQCPDYNIFSKWR